MEKRGVDSRLLEEVLVIPFGDHLAAQARTGLPIYLFSKFTAHMSADLLLPILS
jgi:hypothetical protein